MMSNLPEHVSDQEISEMFNTADQNKDGKISWDEFLVIFDSTNQACDGNPITEKSCSNDKVVNTINELLTLRAWLNDEAKGEDSQIINQNLHHDLVSAK